MRARILLLGLLVGGATSCDVYDPSLLSPDASTSEPPPTDYGEGIGWWSGTDPITSCFSASQPSVDDRPANTPAGDIGPLSFGVRTMRLGSRLPDGTLDESAWTDIGFDMDNTCTRSPNCDSVENVTSCDPPGSIVPSDGNFCRDNVFGRFEYMISTSPDIGDRLGLQEHTFNCSVCQGAYNMLFRISAYNGEPNDSSVRVDIYPSPGIPDLKPIDCSVEDYDKSNCWLKEDRWMVQREYVRSGTGGDNIGESNLNDPSAFVREGYVVASLPPNSMFWFPGDRGIATSFPVVFQGGLVTGKLNKGEDGEWRIDDGIIAGRMAVNDVIDSFRLIGVCEGDVLNDMLINFMKLWPDVLSSGAILPETPCDAISAGIAFTASEASIGELEDVDTSPRPCLNGDAGPDAEADAGVDAGVDASADGPSE